MATRIRESILLLILYHRVRITSTPGTLLLLLMPLIVISHASMIEPPHLTLQNTQMSISNNTTIGTPGFQSNYYLNENITVPAKSTLTLVDLIVIVQANSASISVLGSLRILESTIRMYSSNQSLNLSLQGTNNSVAQLIIMNSSWSIPGNISLLHSNVTITNSSISSGIVNPVRKSQVLSISTQNSSVRYFNDTISGLMHSSPMNEKVVAYMFYSKQVPFSTNAQVPLSSQIRSDANPLVTSVVIDITYSGNNPTGENSLNFSYPNQVYSLKFGNTGSVFNRNNKSLILPLTEPYIDVAAFVKNLSVTMYVANIIGSNSSIEDLNISIFSNDTVAIYGLNYFAYSIIDSSVFFANDSISLDRNSEYEFSNVRSPDHNFLYAVNSSIYLLGSQISDLPGNSPFYNLNSSYLFLYDYVEINATSGSYQDSNFPIAILPSSNAAYVCSMNVIAYNSTLCLGNINGRISNQTYAYFLLSDTISSDGDNYTGSYQITIYNSTFGIAIPQYNYSSSNDVRETFHTNLPVISAQLLTRNLVMGMKTRITFSITLNGCRSMDAAVNSFILPSNTDKKSILNTSILLENGTSTISTTMFTVPFQIYDSLNVDLMLFTSDPTYYGRNIDFSFALPIKLNVNLHANYSYTWMKDQSKLMLIVNYSLSSGPFALSLNTSASISTASGQVSQNNTLPGIIGNSSGRVKLVFYLNATAQNASISMEASNNSLLIINTTSFMSFTIVANSSYYPISSILVTEKGLPQNTPWTITIGDLSYTSLLSEIEINISNGIYEYSFQDVPGYIGTLSTGTVHAFYAVEYLNDTFSQYTYAVLIREQGLSANTTWSILLNKLNLHTNNGSLLLFLPNGTFEATILSPGYTSQNRTYFIIILGSNITVQVIFIKTEQELPIIFIIDKIFQTPFTYLLLISCGFTYLRFYRKSTRICSVCLSPIKRGKLTCSNCKSLKK